VISYHWLLAAFAVGVLVEAFVLSWRTGGITEKLNTIDKRMNSWIAERVFGVREWNEYKDTQAKKNEVAYAELTSSIATIHERLMTGWSATETEQATIREEVGNVHAKLDTLTKQQADQWRSITNSLDRIHGGEQIKEQFSMWHARFSSMENLIASQAASADAIATAIGDRLTNPTWKDCPTCHAPNTMAGDSLLERAVKESFYSEGLGKILSEASRGSAVESPRGPKARKP